MSSFDLIINGMSVALQPANIVYVFVGVLLGTILGILPGIGPVAGMALLIPVTYGMDPTSAMIIMAGIYYGAQYGGAVTAILINTPGEAASLMTTIDGYQMARNGRAGPALAVSAWGSFIAGTLGVVGLAGLAAVLAQVALRFGPAEYFALMFLALSAVSAVSGKSTGMAILALVTGLMISTVGTDLQTGSTRFTFGFQLLESGLGFAVIAIGLFAIGEALFALEENSRGNSKPLTMSGSLYLTREDWRRSLPPILRGGVIGFFFGVLPGVGGVLPTIFSYNLEKRVSKNDVFGELQHLALQLEVRHVVEGFLGRADLVVEIERRRDQPLAMGADQHGADATEQHRPGERCDLLPAHAVTDERIGFFRVPVGRRQVIGLVEIDVVDVAATYEGRYRQGLVAVGNRPGDFLGIEHDVFARADLIALDLVLGVDRLAGGAVDEPATDPMAGRPVERVKGNALRGGRGRVERDRATDLGDFQEALPVCSWGQGGSPAQCCVSNGSGGRFVPGPSACRTAPRRHVCGCRLPRG